MPWSRSEPANRRTPSRSPAAAPTRHERLDAPEVVALGVDVVTDLLDAGLTEPEHPHAARVVRAVGEVLARIHRDLVDREVAEPEREGRVERLGNRVRIDPLDLASGAAEQAHVAPTVEDRRGANAPLADGADGGRVVRRVGHAELRRVIEHLVERRMGRADRDHRLRRVERTRTTERHAGRVVHAEVPVHQHNRIPARVEGLGGLLAREARVVGQVAVAVVVGRRIVRGTALHEEDPLVPRLQPELRVGVVARQRQRGRVRRAAIAPEHHLAAQGLVRQRGGRRTAADLHRGPLLGHRRRTCPSDTD